MSIARTHEFRLSTVDLRHQTLDLRLRLNFPGTERAANDEPHYRYGKRLRR
jgi:hypothetical protein